MDDVDSGLLERVRAALTGLPRGPRRVPPPAPCCRVRAGLLDLLAERLEDQGVRVHRVPHEAQAATVAALEREGPTDVTTARLGVATTGTLVLEKPGGAGQPDRSGHADRSSTADGVTHVCVLHASRVVLGEPEALALLGRHRLPTWSGGPALLEAGPATRERALGHRRYAVVVVGDAG